MSPVYYVKPPDKLDGAGFDDPYYLTFNLRL